MFGLFVPYQLGSLLIGGAFVGAAARLLHPGRERVGVAATVLVGIVATVVAASVLRGAFLVLLPFVPFGLDFALGVVIAYAIVWTWAQIAPAGE
ncbi:MAG TPA: hypothetical protein VE777_09100 [Gaiellales bacterium]|jgi:uncharacterized membrane protein YeaQ/YmgE (transglycosylase-associated protein family)|nr:hypothetical protein [Gaiellales bacterium]